MAPAFITLFGNGIFADIVKWIWDLNWTGLGWVLNPITGVLIRRPCGNRHRCRIDKGRSKDWSDAAIRQGH